MLSAKRMTHCSLKTFAAMLVCALPTFAQYEDLVDIPDAPTRTQADQGVICTLEGVQVSKKEGEKGVSDMSIVFLLTEKPSAYFHGYDAAKKAVVFDFYDTHIGESPIEPITQDPFTNSTIEKSTIDLNKDVEGLKPDIRDLVRVTLYTPFEFQYDVQEDESVITMNFKWSKKIGKALVAERHSWWWKYSLGAAVLGGGGYYAYLKLKPPPPKNTDILGNPPPQP